MQERLRVMRNVRVVIFGAIVGGYAVLAGLGGAEAAFVAGGIAPSPGTAASLIHHV